MEAHPSSAAVAQKTWTELANHANTPDKVGETVVLKWMWLSAAIIGLDLYTKHLASILLEYGLSVPVLPVFKFTLLHNHGAAFSFGGSGGWQRWFFAILAVVVSGI